MVVIDGYAFWPTDVEYISQKSDSVNIRMKSQTILTVYSKSVGQLAEIINQALVDAANNRE